MAATFSKKVCLAEVGGTINMEELFQWLFMRDYPKIKPGGDDGT